MGKSPNGGYQDRMRDDCVAILATILKKRRIAVRDLAEERGLSARSVYRWIRSFGFLFPVTVRGGIVLVDDEDQFGELHKLTQLKIISSNKK